MPKNSQIFETLESSISALKYNMENLKQENKSLKKELERLRVDIQMVLENVKNDNTEKKVGR